MEKTTSKAILARVLIVIASLASVAAVTNCRPWKHKSPEERGEWMAKRIAKELDLNDSQKQVLNKIKDEIVARMKAEKSDRGQQLKEVTTLLRSDTIDNGKLTAIRKRHQAQRESMESLFVEKALELHKVLTPEQRNKAADLIEKHMKKFSGDK
ncbi:MAG: Spy/CpxP family protein refolding chaperone [Turneriella sp.]